MVHDSEVLEPEPERQGGLVRRDAVSLPFMPRHCLKRTLTPRRHQRHTFRQPARPIQPPTPRTSVLGLDRLAQEKRAAAAANGEGSRKKPRLDDGEPMFKGEMPPCLA